MPRPLRLVPAPWRLAIVDRVSGRNVVLSFHNDHKSARERQDELTALARDAGRPSALAVMEVPGDARVGGTALRARFAMAWSHSARYP